MDFVMRKRLAALGVTDSLNNVDCVTAEAFVFIDAEYSALMAEQQKKAIKGKRGRK